MEPANGQQETAIGKYHVFATLGRGGMADVFLAVARGPVGFNKLVVIKRLRSQLAEDPVFRTMFLDEARLAARLSHPNIVNTFEVGEHGRVYYIAMEYLEGQALNKVLREAIKQGIAIPPAFAARIVSDALNGLSYAHELRDYDGSQLGIIHRDISPHNLFVTYDGQSKVVDFGIAKARSTSTNTEVGVLKGKVAYMSPEQAIGESIDARSDLFAMGIVLWELLARQRLFPGDNAAATIHRLMSEPIRRLSSVFPEVPAGLEEIIHRALEKDPDRRFSSASAMRRALEDWLLSEGAVVRSDDVAMMMATLFAPVREDVQGKVRQYMSQFSVATTSQEVRALTQDSVQRLSQSGTGSLLRLGTGLTSAGGSTGSPRWSVPPVPNAAPPSRSPAVPIAVAGFFSLCIVAVLVFGLRRETVVREVLVPATPPSASTSPAQNVPPTPPGPSSPPSSAPAPNGPTPVPPPSQAATHTSHHTPETPVDSHSSVKPVEPAPEPRAEVGYLTLDSTPWSRVSEGGRVLGVTPVVHVPLSAGPHTLSLENSEKGLKSTVTVVVKPGETVSKRVSL